MAELPDNQLNRKISDQESVAKEVTELEADLAALHVTYEQYFMGLERQPPNKQHQELKKRINKLKGAFVRQTAIKFRIQSLSNKFLSYERMWNRTLQEMENGTYRRDVYKAKLHQKKAPAPAPVPPGAQAAEGAQPAPPGTLAAAARPAAPAQPRAAGAPAPVASGTQLSDAKLKAVYDAYVTAKKRCNEDTSKLSYDSVAANLRKQVPELMKKHNAQGVEFKVVIKDGKAILRAVPK